MNARKIGKNLLFTFVAQAVSILVNFVLNIVVPMVVSEYQYAYWQTFVLYSTYVGVLHLGLLDGLVLRYSQYDYEELDKKAFRTHFAALLFIASFFSLLVLLLSGMLDDVINRRVAWLVSVGIITKNIFTYNSYSFQLTDRIKQYALLTIAQRALYGGLVVVQLCLKIDNWVGLCVADLLGDSVGITCCFFANRKICLGKRLSFFEGLKEIFSSINAGIKLLISNWSSMLLVGGAKMIVKLNWNELIFGKVSFAFSVTTLFLTFISAISIVLFPSLKRMRTEELPFLYKKIRGILSPLLVIVMLLYFPAVRILSRWLPRYIESFVYLGILLPSIVYTAKVNLLTNNYMKVYRMEKDMLKINLGIIAIAMAAYSICAFIFDDLMALLVCVVVAVAVRSILSEMVVTRKFHETVVKETAVETVMAIVFMCCAFAKDSASGMVLYALSVLLYVGLLFVMKRHCKLG